MRFAPVRDYRTKEHLGTADMAVIALRPILIREAKNLDNGQEPVAANFADFLVRLANVNKGQGGDYDGLGKSLLGARNPTKGSFKL